MTSVLAPQTAANAPGARARARLLLALVALLLLAAPLLAVGTLALQQRPRAGDAAGAAISMEAANALYAAGQYDVAAQAYAQLLAQGYGGRALLYNQGVAYLQAGAAVEAVDALQAAQRAFPRDVAMRSALADAQRLARVAAPLDGPATTDAFASPSPAAPIQRDAGPLAQVRTQWLSATESALIALLLWSLLAALLLVARTAPRRSGRRTTALFLATSAGVALVFALLLLTV